jgi:dihydrofolate reductase
MGRLIVSVQTTLDGVMDHLEDWFDEQGDVKEHGIEELRAADACLLGRETYEAFKGFWPSASDTYADLFNPMPKYVASRTLSGPLEWNAGLLGPDTAAAVADAKLAHDGNLISYGCGELAGFLAREGLVDEVRVWVHPVVWGDGIRLFQAAELPVRLELVSAAQYGTGVTRLTYRPGAG